MKRALIAALSVCAFFSSPALAQPAQNAPLLDGAAIIGPPPTPGSFGAVADRAGEGLPVSPERVALASRDQGANNYPDPWQAFAPVLGQHFTAAQYPATARLLAAITSQVGPVAGPTKERFQRQRPYVAEPQLARCTPAPTDGLGPYRSYPSGHSTLGYAWALALAEVSPAHAQTLLERGVDYGQSRVICGVHWPSDVMAGRVLAAAIIARLHGDDAFRRLLDEARRELRSL